jgi:AmmeMemoRadiSam system protein B/AmmeMemoRadiSam system protein A
MKRPSQVVLLIAGILVAVGVIVVRAMPRHTVRALAADRAPSTVRAPAVMGTFYPSRSAQLRSAVRTYLEEAQIPRPVGDLVALIVPHAGYSYSGRVAGHAYRSLQGGSYDTVAIVGPSHRVRLEGAALSGLDEWFTPLGRVSVDGVAAQAITKSYPGARVNDAAHDPEHSIEVQLPFLQEVLGDFRLLPILMADFSQENCASLARALAELAEDRRVLLVASSDMSHYPAYDDAVRVDKETLRAIQTTDAGEVAATTKKLMAQGVPGLSTCLCGEGPVKTVLMAAEILGADKVQVLKYANSGDALAGPRGGVVGYCAVALYRSGSSTSGRGEDLNEEQGQQLLILARRAIEEYVAAGRRIAIKDLDPVLLRPAAAFVTLKKDGKLRGCMGSLEPSQPLAETVRDRAIMAASRDFRFSRVRAEELPYLDMEVSVLSPLRRVASPEDIDIARHGVVVVQGSLSGVYLPQVAEEKGWSRDVLLSHLCREKAGLPADAWQKGAALYVFTVQSFLSPAPGTEADVKD